MNSIKNYNSKIKIIQQQLTAGLTREEVAQNLGYSNWRSLDIYMRRLGMRWDGSLKRYISEDEVIQGHYQGIGQSPVKVAKIIALFNDINADPKQIAKQTGFKDLSEMAVYMSARGFIWNDELSNYTRIQDTHSDKDISQDINNFTSDSEMKNQQTGLDIEPYAPLLNFLSNHKDRLLELLEPEIHSRTIPRYFVPGITRTKSFYMSDSLSKLLSEFCSTKNLSQKEVIEAALIEFLCKYSFKKEVDALIKGNNNMHNFA